MKHKQIYALCIMILVLNFVFFSQNTAQQEFITEDITIENLFNNNLSVQQISNLKNGKEVMTRLQTATDMCLKPINNVAKKNLNIVQSLAPSYLMEIIKVIPQEGHENLSQELHDILLNIEQYNDIPYFSESHQKWEKLFTKAHILNTNELKNNELISISLKMDPFGKFTANLSIEQSVDSLVFVLTNPEKLRILGIPVVDSENMLCTVYAFKYADKWILYGTGGLLAPEVPILGEKAEVSFVNRISTFCRYMFTDLQ